MSKNTNSYEYRYLEYVRNEIADAIDELTDGMSDKYKSIMESKKYVWENIYDMDPAEIASNNQVIDLDISTYENRAKQKRVFEKMYKSPYFGRLDFKIDGEDEIDKYYIGLANFVKKNAYESLVYDWRAPISTMFYDYEIGKAKYIAPVGDITGTIENKKQYKIKDGKIIYMFESSLKIDDEILQQELGNKTDKKMDNIVATIQKQQNEIIRSDRKNTLIVQGVAGSGKTSIALHRVAYLLYRYKDTLKSNNILIISPNKVFSDYISNVLPELGEENILEMSFDDLAENELKGIAKFESRYDQLEYIIKIGNDENDKRIHSISNKSKIEFLNYLKEYVKYLEETIFDPVDFNYEYYTLKKDEIKDLFLNKYKDIELFKRIDWITDYIVERIEVDFDTKINKKTKKDIKKNLLSMCSSVSIVRLYENFLIWVQENYNMNAGRSLFVKSKFLYEDVYPVILLKFYLYGSVDFQYVKHLLIDEMQDYTPVQYEIISKIFKCPKTILGDMNQTINPYMNLSELDCFNDVFSEEVNLVKLLKSYRSTFEITQFTQKISKVDGIEPIMRNGKEPEIIKVDDDIVSEIVNAINSLLRERYTNIAVLCKNLKEAKQIYSEIDGLVDINLILPESKNYVSGIIVTTSYLAKGLEFDGVIIPNVDSENYKSEVDRRILYVSCTRALHELKLIYEGELCRFV